MSQSTASLICCKSQICKATMHQTSSNLTSTLALDKSSSCICSPDRQLLGNPTNFKCNSVVKFFIKLLTNTLYLANSLTFLSLLLLLSTHPSSVGSTATVPDTKACCRAKGVSEYCVENLCNTESPPAYEPLFEIVETRCPNYMHHISTCLADGRNHRPCCSSHSRNDREECLHLCDGSAPPVGFNGQWQIYKRYVACLTHNVNSMFGCMREGYRKGPSSPRSAETVRVSATSATLKWGQPEKLASAVTKYKVYYLETNKTSLSEVGLAGNQSGLAAGASGKRKRNSDVQKWQSISTTATNCKLAGLNPDTKYLIYVEAVNEAGGGVFKSLPSNSVSIVTRGVAPSIEPHHSTQASAIGTLATLVCIVKVYGSEHLTDLRLSWQKRTHDTMQTISESKAGASDFIHTRGSKKKYQATSYEVVADSMGSGSMGNGFTSFGNFDSVFEASDPATRGSAGSADNTGQKRYVMSLRLHDVSEADFGAYKCVARNLFGRHLSTVHLIKANLNVPPAEPYNLTACCEREGVQPSCLNTCKHSGANQLPPTDSPENPYPSWQCVRNAPMALKCSTDGMKYDSCCLAKGVPFRCLSFCDGSLRFPLSTSLFTCLLQTTDILSCHLEVKTPIPFPPSVVNVVAKSSRELQLEWESVPKATTYYVYYRVVGGSHGAIGWQRVTSVAPRASLKGLIRGAQYQIIVLSANDAGVSDSSKPVFASLKGLNFLQRDQPQPDSV